MYIYFAVKASIWINNVICWVLCTHENVIFVVSLKVWCHQSSSLKGPKNSHPFKDLFSLVLMTFQRPL